MQKTYHVTCKCGHDFPIPARFLSPDEDKRTTLLKALEGLHCPDCIKAAVAEVHALREHLLETGAVPLDITEEGWKSLARNARRNILRENIIPPLPSRSPDISDEIMRYPETLPKDLHQPLECPDKSPYSWAQFPEYPDTSLDINEVIKSSITEDFRNIFGEPWDAKVKFPISEDAWKAWGALNITELGWRDLAKNYSIPEEVIAILHAIDSWNRNYPVGTEVLVTQAGEEQPGNLLAYHTYLTTSPARLLAGKPVVEVSGLGPIDLDRLIPFFA